MCYTHSDLLWQCCLFSEDVIIDQLPDQMYNYFKFEQSSVDQEYWKSDLKEKKNKKQNLMNSAMTNLFNFQQEQIKMIMQQNMFNLMKHFQQTQELCEQHA